MIKNFLIKLRSEGWTQEEISKKTGIRQGQISTLMNGGDCKASTLVKIARAFNVSTDIVLGLNEPERKLKSNTIEDHGALRTEIGH